MSTYSKVAGQLARKFFKLSLVDGVVSPERVAGILEYMEIHRPANPVMVLRAYHRLIAIELARSAAVVEHAGPITDAILQRIAAALTTKYKRPVKAVAKSNPALLAGLRIHLGDDVYEASAAGQLAALAESVR
jgi:F-type H+-transporting ATPase subunit delta